MINFDEEITKFHPSLEIGEVEQAVKTENAATDLTDVMLEMMEKQSRETLKKSK